MIRSLFLLAALALPLSACGGEEALDPAPDGAPELPDPDPDTPLDVDPLSRQDGQSSDEAGLDSAEVGREVFDRPIEGVEPESPTDPSPQNPDL